MKMHGPDRFGRRFFDPQALWPDAPRGYNTRGQHWSLGSGELPIMVARRQRRLPSPPLRWELVARVRREIEAGTYETPEELEAALKRLLEELEKDE